MLRPCFFIIGCITGLITGYSQRQQINFNYGWQFYKFKSNDTVPKQQGLYDTARKGFLSQFTNEYVKDAVSKPARDAIQKEWEKARTDFYTEYSLITEKNWQKITLPHTANIEPLVAGPFMWQGIAYYRKQFWVDRKNAGKIITIAFEGAMQQADVWLNGKLLVQHKGGYTPFYLECSNHLFYNKPNEIIIRMDSRAGPDFPVGKSLLKNGFNYWSGIYRNVSMVITGPIHITNAVQERKKMGGGVFFLTPVVTKDSALSLIKTHYINESNQCQKVQIKQVLLSPGGNRVGMQVSAYTDLKKGEACSLEQEIQVKHPLLWSTDHPFLYTLQTILLEDGVEKDRVEQRVGFRKFRFSREKGFELNGEYLQLVGVNRHQDYPYIGNALSDAAQYRDMKKIKEAGFNTVRLSHYPQSPAVYAAADELGLLLLDAIPGWQFFNNKDIFRERVFRDIEDMIRRDRNHPSILLWEANLNESYPPDSFRMACHQLVHAELPAGEYFTVGETYGAKHTEWDVAMANWYDDKDTIFRNTYERVQDVQPGAPSFIKEYGDWEYGGVESTTRGTRANGETALLRGLWNILWEHNTNLNYAGITGDAIWAMYDNNIPAETRNYEWGVADYFRLPKFIAPLFRSQLEPYRKIAGIVDNSPYLYIANWWTSRQGKGKVVVLSNCDSVVLKVNGKIVGKQRPDHGPTTAYGLFDKGGADPFDGGNCVNFKHPPYTFKEIKYEAGELKAEGYIHGKKVREQFVYTPESPERIMLKADYSGKLLKADKADAIFVYATLVDKNNTVECLDNETEIIFSVSGGVKITGPSKVKVRGGIASVLLQSATVVPDKVELFAEAKNMGKCNLKIRISK